ncbi:MAG: cytochrome b/b6 domain-containing protein [Devosia sp.]|nr:cytochrome b/b6 domain-containing protein [Devosia sp.]
MQKLARTDRLDASSADVRRPLGTARVWDPLVRIFHWSLATSFAVAWLTRHSWADVHHWAGYAAGALIVLRLIWGFLGTPYARFTQFVRHPTTIIRYLSDILTGREARYLGHNPAGGAMVLVLMAAMAGAALSGWMMTTDTFYGVSWVEHIHDLLGNGLLLLVLAHLAGVALASIRHRENLVRAMISGRKRLPESGDVT